MVATLHTKQNIDDAKHNFKPNSFLLVNGADSCDHLGHEWNLCVMCGKLCVVTTSNTPGVLNVWIAFEMTVFHQARANMTAP